MIKRGGLALGILFAVLCLLPQPALGAGTEKSYLDQWHYSGDTWTSEGEVFYLSHLRLTDEKIYLTIDNKSTVINLGGCYETSLKKYCFKEIYNDISSATEKSNMKFIGKDVYAGIHLVFYKLGADIKIDRAFSPSSPIKDQDIEVAVTFNNPNEYWTDYFNYTDIYPEGVYLVTASGDWEKSLHGVRYNKNLAPFSTKTLYYTIRILDYIAFTNYGSFSHKINGVVTNKNTSAFKVDLYSKKPFTFTAKSSPASFETGEDVEISLDVKNKKASTLEILSLEITPPQNITFSFNAATFQRNGSKYYWSGDVRVNETVSLGGRMRVFKTGKYSVPIKIVINEADKKTYTEYANLSFTTSYKKPELIFSMSHVPISVSEGGKYRVAFSVKNPNVATSLKQVFATVTSPITPQATGYIEEIRPEQTKTLILMEDLDAPTVMAETTYKFTGDLTFDTSFELGTSYSTTGNVKVTPINKSVFLTQTVTAPAFPKIGDNVTVSVKVKHSNEEIITLDVADSYSPGLIFKGGTTAQTIYYNSPSEKQAYLYSLVIPANYSSKEIVIRSDVSVRGKPGLVTAIKVIPVNVTVAPPKNTSVQTLPVTAIGDKAVLTNASKEAPANNASETGTPENQLQNESQPPEKNIEEKSAGFVDGVMDFFRRLFGFK